MQPLRVEMKTRKLVTLQPNGGTQCTTGLRARRCTWFCFPVSISLLIDGLGGPSYFRWLKCYGDWRKGESAHTSCREPGDIVKEDKHRHDSADKQKFRHGTLVMGCSADDQRGVHIRRRRSDCIQAERPERRHGLRLWKPPAQGSRLATKVNAARCSLRKSSMNRLEMDVSREIG